MLADLDQPICIKPVYVATQATALRVKHHTKGGFACTKDHESAILFNVDSRTGGLSPKRVFHDAANGTILDMRRYHGANETYVGVPNDNALPAAVIAPRATRLKDKVDVYVKNAVQDGKEVKLEVRGQDIWEKNTYVYCGDDLVMQIRFVNYVTSYVPFSSNQWDVAVAKGIDLLLVSCFQPMFTLDSGVSNQTQATTIVVYLATTLYDNTRFQSDYGQECASGDAPRSGRSTARDGARIGMIAGAGAGAAG